MVFIWIPASILGVFILFLQRRSICGNTANLAAGEFHYYYYLSIILQSTACVEVNKLLILNEWIARASIETCHLIIGHRYRHFRTKPLNVQMRFWWIVSCRCMKLGCRCRVIAAPYVVTWWPRCWNLMVIKTSFNHVSRVSCSYTW